jgi:hypothetical protein
VAAARDLGDIPDLVKPDYRADRSSVLVLHPADAG